jgi:serine/threonine-protein kinase
MGLAQPRVVGRYALYDEIAAGGMATVHYGRLLGPVGFSRTVAIKRLHAQHAKDPEFVSMFLDEARLAARIQHPNVVQTLDVVSTDDELFLVMDYVQGESVARLIRASAADNKPIPLEVVSAIICGALLGLHAAHEAIDEAGKPLGIVHRDVSPQNILVGADGVPRVLDFGVAKAAGRVQTTREGQLKGKIAYMAQEQLNLTAVDRRADVYATGVVLWEALTLTRLYAGENEAGIMAKVLKGVPPPPSSITPVPEAVEKIVMRALEYDQPKRFPSAKEMATALEAAIPMASAPRVAEWVERLVGGQLAVRRESVARIESLSGNRPIPVAADTEPEPTRALAPGEESGRSSPTGPASRAPADLSTISASSAAIRAQAEKRGPGRGRWLAAGGAVALAVVAYVAMQSGRTNTAQLDEPRNPGVSGSVPSEAPPVPATSVSTPAPLPTEVAVSPSAAAAATTTTARSVRKGPARPTPSAAIVPPSVRTAPSATSVSSPAASSTPCTIKSYLDESGVKHFTKECN